MKKFSIAAAVLAAGVTITGCTPFVVHDASEAITETQSTDHVPTEDSQAEESSAVAEAAFNTDAEFGDTVEYPDGLKLTVTHRGDAQISEYGSAGMCEEGDPVKLYDMEFENGTDEYFAPWDDANIYGLYVDSEGYDTEADSVFDEVDGVKTDAMMSFAELRPGAKGRGTVGFCMDSHDADFVMTVDTNWSGESDRQTVAFQ